MSKFMTNEELYQLAKKRVLIKQLFIIHSLIYLLGLFILIFVYLNLQKSWTLFVVIGWGLALFLHWIINYNILNSKQIIDQEFTKLQAQYQNNKNNH
ncbi:2TM domain-containing protein [Turicibacter sanguinis]|uniref:2TM domain-containing protein n=1 Tax=Turicibacter sanguinis TaxID=154288 RepID=UPI0018AB0848|nr:2TM domain-containing protein [Turicibacter sanguinis]MDB8553025.1 2TM domain-containing protein [Turicibacter sanguinis]